MDGLWMLDHLLPEQPHDCKERLLKAQGETYRRDFLPRVPAFPDVRLLFETLKQHGALLAIATTCQKDELSAYDGRLKILELTDVVACGEMVKHGKPDPSLFQTCLTRLQIVDASLTVAIGDTPYDAEAARKLGMRSLGVITGGFSAETPREAGCNTVFEQVTDVATLWRSAPEPIVLPHPTSVLFSHAGVAVHEPAKTPSEKTTRRRRAGQLGSVFVATHCLAPPGGAGRALRSTRPRSPSVPS
jgi:HAD superfamily hydrolase (TIGR01509 family)